jgi:hypothetical protein
MAITSFTVDSVEVTPLIGTFEVRETIGGVSTLSCDIVSVGSPVERYGVFSQVAVLEDGVTIFAGTVTQAREKGVGGPVLDADGNPQIVTTITAEDHNRIGDRVSATETVTAGTLLKAFLATLVTNYLASFGVTLDGSQVNGPALPAMSFDIAQVSDVLKALADATGYVWRIDYDKKLRMWSPGDLAAPFDIDQSDVPPKWGGDVEIETILGDTYANRVVIKSNPVNAVQHTETFTGDGVADSVTLEYTLTKAYGYVTYDGIFQTLRFPGDADAASWTYDASDNSLTRTSGPIGAGKILSITFDGTFTASATAEDAGEIAAHGLYEHVERRSDITTKAAAQSIADSVLAQLLAAGEQTITYTTRYSAPTLRAGQLQNIVAPARDVSGDFIIRDIRLFTETNPTSAEGWLTREISAKQQQVLVGKWQQTYQDWLRVGGGGGSAGATVVGGGGGSSSAGPANPFKSVQFNEDGHFGGDAEFTYDTASTTAMVGLSHNPGGADNLLVGEGHTVS